MAASKTPRAAKSTAARLLNLTDIRALARVVNQYDLSELELDNGSERLRIRRERSNGAVTMVSQPVEVRPAPAVPAPVPAAAAEAAATEAERPDDGSVLVTSPFVGTFYQAPSPESPPFVEPGQSVKKGQVLCIVEAMKLMNEIEAETDCKIVEVLARNAEPVEFGQALFRVFPVA